MDTKSICFPKLPQNFSNHSAFLFGLFLNTPHFPRVEKILIQVHFLSEDGKITPTERERFENLVLKESFDEVEDKLHSTSSRIDEDFQCHICFSDLMIDPTTLCCGHSFCMDCITQWFRQQSKCPICRKLSNYSELAVNVILQKVIIKQYPTKYAELKSIESVNIQIKPPRNNQTPTEEDQFVRTLAEFATRGEPFRRLYRLSQAGVPLETIRNDMVRNGITLSNYQPSQTQVPRPPPRPRPPPQPRLHQFPGTIQRIVVPRIVDPQVMSNVISSNELMEQLNPNVHQRYISMLRAEVPVEGVLHSMRTSNVNVEEILQQIRQNRAFNLHDLEDSKIDSHPMPPNYSNRLLSDEELINLINQRSNEEGYERLHRMIRAGVPLQAIRNHMEIRNL